MLKYILLGVLIPTLSFANSASVKGSCSESKYINFEDNSKIQIQCFNYNSIAQEDTINSILNTTIGKLDLYLNKGRFDDDIVSLKINDTKVDAKGLCIEAQNHFFCSISIYDQYKIKSTISINFVEEY